MKRSILSELGVHPETMDSLTAGDVSDLLRSNSAFRTDVREWADSLREGFQEAWAVEEGKAEMERRETGVLGEDWEGEAEDEEMEDEEMEDEDEDAWWKHAEPK